MTTGRSQLSNPGQPPGSRAWRDSVQRLKRDLDRDNAWLFRALERLDAGKVEERQQVTDRADSLRIEELLTYMNDILLDGQGVIETAFYWEADAGFEDEDEDDEDDDDEGEEDDEDDEGEEDDEDDEDEEDEVEFPVLSIALTWKQAAQVRVNVELIKQEDGFLVRINDEEMAATARVLQTGLVDAFDEQMSILEEVDEDEDE